MSIKDKYTVKSIKPEITYDWLLYKHYAHRIPSISYAFGLYEGDILQGVLTLGMPQSNDLREGVCGLKYRDWVYELNRVIINDGLDKNSLSYFISSCLKTLPDKMIIVSYADSNHNHHGYIYQALNFYYTGTGGDSREFKVNGKQISTRSFKDTLKNNRMWDYNKTYSENVTKIGGDVIKLKPKFRYIYFHGTKKDRAELLKALRWTILPYPKGDNKRYDASYQPMQQPELF